MTRNNFDILRIVLATIVFYFHMGTLVGINELSQLPGHFAVHCFFVVSGYLIVKSYIRNNNLNTYTKSRFFRIYPLYFVVITVCFAVGYLNYSQSFYDYLRQGGLKYLLFNYSFANFLAPTLPDMFIDNARTAVNGALWTIKVEVMFYISVPIIYGYFNKYVSNIRLTIGLGVLSVFSYYIISYLIDNHGFHRSLVNQLPSMMIFFMVGALINFVDFSFLKVKFLVLIVPLIYLFQDVYPVYALLVGLFVFIVAKKIRPIGVSEKIGDVSYGIYIWHFPVIQLLIMHGFFENYFVGGVIASVLVMTLALSSWHIIESKLVHKPK